MRYNKISVSKKKIYFFLKFTIYEEKTEQYEHIL